MKKPTYSSALCILNHDKEKHLAPITQCRKTEQSFIALITSAFSPWNNECECELKTMNPLHQCVS